MKRLVLFLLVLSSVFAAPFTHGPSEWAFAVSFPGKPKISKKKTAHPKAEIREERAYFESKARVWAVERVTYSIPIPSERIDAAYEGGKRGMLKMRPGKVVKEEVIEILGYRGRRYQVEYKNGTRLSDHRVVIVGSEVYQFIFERPITEGETDDAFFDSITRKKG